MLPATAPSAQTVSSTPHWVLLIQNGHLFRQLASTMLAGLGLVAAGGSAVVAAASRTVEEQREQQGQQMATNATEAAPGQKGSTE